MTYFLLILKTFLGGASNNISKYLIVHMPIYILLFLKTVVVFLFINPRGALAEFKMILTDRKLSLLFFGTALLSTFASVVYYYGLSLVPISIVSTLTGSLGILNVAIVGYLFFGSRYTRGFVLYSLGLLPFVVLVLYQPSNTDTAVLSTIGVLSIVANTLLVAFETHLTKKQLGVVSISTYIAFKGIVSTLTFGILIVYNDLSLANVFKHMTLIVALVLIVSLLNGISITYLHAYTTKKLGATIITNFGSLVPVFSILIAYVVYKDNLMVSQWVGVIGTLFILFLMRNSVDEVEKLENSRCQQPSK